MSERQTEAAGSGTHGQAVPAFVAFAAYALCNWLLTSRVFPIGTALDPFCRDVATLAEGALFLVVALVASRRPRVLAKPAFVALPCALSLAGAALLALPATGSPVLATLGITALLLSAVFVMLSAGCALARLDARLLPVCVLVGLGLSYLLRFALAGLEGTPALLLYVALQLAAVFAGRSDVATTLDGLAHGETPEELTLTNPFSFLPKNHRLFVCLGLFQLAYGIGLSFGEVNATPLATFAGVLPLMGAALFALAARRMPRLDTLFGMALLLVMSGFLFTGASQQLGAPITSNLLEAGSSCFMLVFWPALAMLAARNRTGTLPLFAWSGFLLSVGVTAGAALGRLFYAGTSAGVVLSSILSALVVLSMAAYAMFGIRGFSFDKTVASLAASPEVHESAAPARPQSFLADMAATAELTAREREVFELLAQGRNGGHIQRQLGVSYNTVKTHVAHIYTKFGVHSHQELIDLVEERAGR